MLFADDSALPGFSHKFSAMDNYMEFGHGAGKCGFMVVATDPAEKVALQTAGLRLHGVEVEIVDSYKLSAYRVQRRSKFVTYGGRAALT